MEKFFYSIETTDLDYGQKKTYSGIIKKNNAEEAYEFISSNDSYSLINNSLVSIKVKIFNKI